jgi:hypothetical protein
MVREHGQAATAPGRVPRRYFPAMTAGSIQDVDCLGTLRRQNRNRAHVPATGLSPVQLGYDLSRRGLPMCHAAHTSQR